jgi:hypothetical protein
MGMRNIIILLYVSLALWVPHLIYFWFSVISLCIAPFVFNPHQFSFSDFVIDYREFLRWMSRGNSRTKASSWYGYCRLSRTMITGYKKKKLGHPSEKLSGDVPRAPWKAVIFSEIVWPLCLAALFVIAYMFVKSFKVDGVQPPSPLIRIALVSVGPMVWNAAILLGLFFISLFLGPMMSSWTRFASVMATLAHSLGLFGLIVSFEFFVRFPRDLLYARWLIRCCSGSLSPGTHPMRCSVSLPSLPSSVPSRRSSLQCSLHVNTSTTKPTGHGGPENGTAVVSATPLSPSQLVNMWLRLWKCLSGAPTSFWDISC